MSKSPDYSDPMVSVIIPLYRSKPFVAKIVQNVKALNNVESVEIIISDRHSADDAIDCIKALLKDDQRISYVQENDHVSWVDHYNLLIDQAKGKYFMWMPHDDEFPEGYVSKLRTSLESDPEVVLAFGSLDTSYAKTWQEEQQVYSIPSLLTAPAPWDQWSALKLLMTWNLGIAFRGLIRKETVVRHRLSLKHTRNDVDADIYWVFGLALLGEIRFVKNVSCKKYFHSNNTHAQWKYNLTARLERLFIPLKYIKDFFAFGRVAYFVYASVIMVKVFLDIGLFYFRRIIRPVKK